MTMIMLIMMVTSVQQEAYFNFQDGIENICISISCLETGSRISIGDLIKELLPGCNGTVPSGYSPDGVMTSDDGSSVGVQEARSPFYWHNHQQQDQQVISSAYVLNVLDGAGSN